MTPVSTTFLAIAPRRFSRCSRSILVALAALVFWAAGSVAFAASAAAAVAFERPASADVPAPMCDPVGASVAAQPDMDLPLVDRGRFEELPCEAWALMLRSQVRGASHPEQAVRGDAPERPEQPAREVEPTRHAAADPFVSTLPVRSEPLTLDRNATAGLTPSRGHHRGVYRPPVAAA